MAGRAAKMKRWGVSMETIKELRTVTSDLLFTHKKLGGGIHGGRLSGRFHYELRSLIDASKNYADFTKRMSRFAKRWLPGGAHGLPNKLKRDVIRFSK